MARKYKTASQLNAQIGVIIKNGYTPITDQIFVKQTYNWILKPRGKRNSHMVMTYEEAKAEMAKKIKDNPLTKKEYQDELIRFQQDYAERLTFTGERKFQKEYMTSVINDAMEYTGDYVNTDRMSMNTLRLAFQMAGEKRAEYTAKNGGQGSNSFYDYLLEILGNFK